MNPNTNPDIRQTPFGEVDMNELADIRDVEIDMSLPQEKRRESYLRQIKNPRLYRHGDTVIRLKFPENGPALKELLREYLWSGGGMRL